MKVSVKVQSARVQKIAFLLPMLQELAMLISLINITKVQIDLNQCLFPNINHLRE